MALSGKILLADDSPEFLNMYRTILAAEGYEADEARNGVAVLAKLENPEWDLVLLDQKLQGFAETGTRLDMIQGIRERAPGAKVIIITGYADAAFVERAFASGAYDCIEKNQHLEAIMKIKVRYALEAARERRMAALTHSKREEVIHTLWKGVLTEADTHRKGRLLEDLLALLFRSIPGFERTQTARRSENEQIDLLVPNDSSAPPWQQTQSQYFLVECKTGRVPLIPRRWTSCARRSDTALAVAA